MKFCIYCIPHYERQYYYFNITQYSGASNVSTMDNHNQHNQHSGFVGRPIYRSGQQYPPHLQYFQNPQYTQYPRYQYSGYQHSQHPRCQYAHRKFTHRWPKGPGRKLCEAEFTQRQRPEIVQKQHVDVVHCVQTTSDRSTSVKFGQTTISSTRDNGSSKLPNTEDCIKRGFIAVKNGGTTVDVGTNETFTLSCFFIAVQHGLECYGMIVPAIVLRRFTGFPEQSIQMDTSDHGECIQRLCDSFAMRITFYTSNDTVSRVSKWIGNPAMSFVPTGRDVAISLSIVSYDGHYELIASETPTSPDISKHFRENQCSVFQYSELPVPPERPAKSMTLVSKTDTLSSTTYKDEEELVTHISSIYDALRRQLEIHEMLSEQLALLNQNMCGEKVADCCINDSMLEMFEVSEKCISDMFAKIAILESQIC